MMDRAEMVRSLRGEEIAWGTRNKIADELERLGHIETEHQGCTENMASLVRERNEAERTCQLAIKRAADNARERDEAESRHRMYGDDIGQVLDSVREKRRSGEPAQPDYLEIRRLIGDRNEARAQRDAAYRALDELREQLEASVNAPSVISHENLCRVDGLQRALDKLDALDPRKQEQP